MIYKGFFYEIFLYKSYHKFIDNSVNKGEPVAWYGPIVVNTEEELEVAFDEYQRETFVKHKK
jgi:hypothetical protein